MNPLQKKFLISLYQCLNSEELRNFVYLKNKNKKMISQTKIKYHLVVCLCVLSSVYISSIFFMSSEIMIALPLYIVLVGIMMRVNSMRKSMMQLSIKYTFISVSLCYIFLIITYSTVSNHYLIPLLILNILLTTILCSSHYLKKMILNFLGKKHGYKHKIDEQEKFMESLNFNIKHNVSHRMIVYSFCCNGEELKNLQKHLNVFRKNINASDSVNLSNILSIHNEIEKILGEEIWDYTCILMKNLMDKKLSYSYKNNAQ